MHRARTSCFPFLLPSALIAFNLTLAPAQAQNLFVGNEGNNTIVEFSPTGVDLGTFANTGLNSPYFLVFRPAAVPAPPSLLVMGAGLLLSLGRLRRRA